MTRRLADWGPGKLARAVAGEWHGGKTTVESVETDTRKELAGALFVALRGDRFDGHDFLEAAVQGGANAALVDSPADVEIPQLVVENTLEALQRLGHAVWREATDEGLHSVALTGSNGKTTTKEFLAALFRILGRTHHTPGNFNNHIGVPLTLCGLPADAEFAVIEMGANDFGDIRELISFAPARQRVLVSIGAAHLEKLGDLDGVRQTKSEIFEHSSPGDIAVIPVEHRPGLNLEPFEGRVYLVGEGGDVEFTIDARAGTVSVKTDKRSVTLPSPYPGVHNATNLALSVATLIVGGFAFDTKAAAAQLRSLVLPGGRLRRQSVGDILFVDDAYNANPTSAVASYQSFLEIAEHELDVAPSDRVVVLGEMFELGEGAERMHAETAEAIAMKGGVDTYIWVGPFAEEMAASASKYAGEHHAAATVEAAAKLLPKTGLVFLKASRGQRLERIIDLVDSA